MRKLLLFTVVLAVMSGVASASTGGVTVPTWDDLVALDSRVADLERRVAALEAQSEPPTTTTTTTTTVPSDPSPTATSGPALHGLDIDETNTGLAGAGYTYDPTSDSWSHPDRGPLQVVNSGMSTSHDGQVIEHVEIRGMLKILHRDVTVRHVRVVYDGTMYAVDAYRNIPDDANFLLKWSDLEHVGGADSYSAAGTRTRYGQVNHVNIHGGFGTCIVLHTTGSAAYNYCHELTRVDGAHTNGLALERTSDRGGPFALVGNRTEGGTTATITMFARYGAFHDVLVADNFMSGGTSPSYCLHGPENKQAGDGTRNIHIVGNVFDRDPYPECGQYGPYRHWNGDRPGARWCNNRFVDGTPVGTEVGC